MELAEALQELGFNKYEAEAYAALTVHGPMTGYEVGKRSAVPLSRSYEILERLTEQGWVLRQPGEPPRYMALPAGATLERLRDAQSAQLAALATAFRDISQVPQAAGFWVLKSREAILARLSELIMQAQQRVELALAPTLLARLSSAFDAVRDHVAVVRVPPPGHDDGACAVCIDTQTVLVGSLTPAATCQALISTDPTLIAVMQTVFTPVRVPMLTPSPSVAGTDWLTWEMHKQQLVRQTPTS